MPHNKEKEVRIKVNDIRSFRKKLKQLGAVRTVKYSCIDYVCEPNGKHWDPHFINLKIRRQISGDRTGIIEMSFHKVKWVKNIKSCTLGFKAILDIPKTKIKEFIKIMGWQILTSYSRKGEHYKLNGFDFTLENIQRIGYYMEIETQTIEKLKDIVEALGEERNIIKKSVPEMVLDKLEK